MLDVPAAAAAPAIGTRATAGRVSWQRNLAAMWVAEFFAIFAFSFCFPVLSILLNRDLRVVDPHALALWTGLSIGAGGLGMACLSPVWGALADRYGRRPMVLRSMLGGALTVGLVGVAQTALQVASLRFLQGATAGTVPAANSLVVAETPRERLGWAFGVLNSSVAVAGAVAPLAGGLCASIIGERGVFLAAGVLLVAAAIPVFVFVRETPIERRPGPAPPLMARVRAAGPGTARMLAVLVAAQGLLQFTWSADQQLVVLRLLRIDSNAAASASGLAFAMAGVGATLAAVTYSRLARSAGYRRLAILGAAVMTVGTVSLGLTTSAAEIVVGMAVIGGLFGLLNPCVGSMLALESPREVQSTVFGINASSLAAGSAFGPFLTGGVTAVLDIPAGLVVACFGTALFAVLMIVAGREPTWARR